MNSTSLISTLKAKLVTLSSLLVGCKRRNLYDIEFSAPTPPSWRHLRGNAILASIGTRRSISTPVGDTQEAYFYGDHLLAFRGGQWKSYWADDLFDIWSLFALTLPTPPSPSIYVITEYKGELTAHLLPVPPTLNPQLRVDSLVHSLETHTRFSKDGPRALSVCPHCPHKRRCDAADKLHDDTADWSTSYPYP